MMKKWAFVMLLLLVVGLQAMAGDFKEYYKEPLPGEYAMHQSHYDYADFARKVTKGCKTNYDKIKAIYQWICNNISYDTSYQIYSADECVDKGKGVCQAYCELFFHLAKAVDVDVEIISGYSKDRRGNIDKAGHAWLFAYTRANYGFLLDPTWGAGTVENKKFYKNDDCWVWFDVDPEWMILSHLPKNQHYQLVKKPVSSKEFSQLTPVSELLLEYGLDVVGYALDPGIMAPYGDNSAVVARSLKREYAVEPALVATSIPSAQQVGSFSPFNETSTPSIAAPERWTVTSLRA